MIQGAGITCSVAFTHRHYRQRQKITHARLETIRHRKAMCQKHGITRGEYMRRFGLWCELRALVRSIRQQEERRQDRIEVSEWMLRKAETRAQDRAKREAEEQRQKATRDFRAFIVHAPVDE